MKAQHKLTFDSYYLTYDSLHLAPLNWQNFSQPISPTSIDEFHDTLLPELELGRIAGNGWDSRAPVSQSRKIIGDDRNNKLRGTNRSDVIKGKGGNDTLLGLAGSDTLSGDAGNDKLLGGAGDDALNGGKGRDLLDGETGNDTLFDTAGDNITDTLRGGVGNDYLTGGKGGDVLEGGSGNDNLFSNLVDGSIDTMRGGVGNDHYYVAASDPALDLTIELPDQGIDTVFLTVGATNWTLADSIENLQFFILSTGVTGIGNSLDNIIQGGTGNDTLQGVGGNDLLSGGLNSDDILIGGEGADRFLFDGGKATTFPAGVDNRFGIDTITDFISGTDKIALARDSFIGLTTAIGQDLGVEFASVADDVQAETSNALIVYSQASDKLFFNSNGSTTGFGSVYYAGAFATVTGVSNLTSADFQVVATGLANIF